MSVFKSSFSLIFWGLLLVVLGFSIGGFDLLPDSIGYIMIAVALHPPVQRSKHFGRARLLALGLLILELVRLTRFFVVTDPDIFDGLETVILVLHTLLIWVLCGGIIEVARARGRDELADRAASRRVLYLVMQGVMWGVVLMAQDDAEIAALTFIPLILGMLFVGVLILGLMLHARRELGGPPRELMPPGA